MKFLFLFVILLFNTYWFTYSQAVTINQFKSEYSLSSTDIRIFKEKSGKLTYQQVSSPFYSDSFKVCPIKELILEDSGVDYWIKFNITNKSDSNSKWVLEFPDFRINHIEFYDPSDRGVKIAGFTYPFLNRVYPHKNFLYNLNIPVGRSYTYYARLKTDHLNYLFINIKKQESITGYALSEYFLLALFYGVLLCLLTYNILLYINLKEGTRVYYVLYLFSLGLLALSKDGLGFQYLWPNFPLINKYLFPIAELLMIIFAGLYCQSFLKLKKTNHYLYAAIISVIVARILFFLIGLVFNLEIIFLQWYDIIPLGIYFIIGLAVLKKGYRPARYFVLAFSTLFLGFAIVILLYIGLLSVNMFTVYSVNLAVMGEMIFLSMALGENVKDVMLAKEAAQKRIIAQLKENEALKDKVNRELESKVAERTEQLNKQAEELKQANVDLAQLTSKLNEMNARLDLDNWNLNKEVKEKTKAIVLAEEISYKEFVKVFPDTLSCLRHLEELKWGHEYKCKRCANNKYSDGPKLFTRKCTKCDHIESVTSDTLFHSIKFPLEKAFYIVYTSAIAKNKITLKYLSEALDLRMNTCSDFRRKVLERKEELVKRSGRKNIEKWEQLVLNKIF